MSKDKESTKLPVNFQRIGKGDQQSPSQIIEAGPIGRREGESYVEYSQRNAQNTSAPGQGQEKDSGKTSASLETPVTQMTVSTGKENWNNIKFQYQEPQKVSINHDKEIQERIQDQQSKSISPTNNPAKDTNKTMDNEHDKGDYQI